MPNHTAPYPTTDNRATAIVSVKDISVSFGARQLLSHIDLEIQEGEIVTIIGPNGSGKTTLAKIILGLVTPAKGTVTIKKGTRVGYMPQKMVVDPVMPLTVERFLRLPLKKNTGQVVAVAEEVGIAALLKSQMHTVSGGEMQRIMLAYALLCSPELLILDEPVQGMDIKGQAEFYALIDIIRSKRHCAVLMISHDLHMVMQKTDKVVCINHHICCVGTPEDVSKHPEYVALFGKENIQSLSIYTHHHDHEHDMSGDIVKNST